MTQQTRHARVISTRVEKLRKIITGSLAAHTLSRSRNSHQTQQHAEGKPSARSVKNDLSGFGLPAIALFQHYLVAGFGIASK
jgi:hypothetical protein